MNFGALPAICREHIHVIATPGTTASLAKAFGHKHNDCARWLNIRRRESGHVWQNCFFSCPLETSYLWAVPAYVERNPVRAGLVERRDEWRWSSARNHLEIATANESMRLEAWAQNWTPGSWRMALNVGLDEAALKIRLAEATQRSRPLGDDAFIDSCEKQCGLPLRKQRPGPKPKGQRAEQQNTDSTMTVTATGN